MSDQLLEVLPWLLNLESKDNGLLTPVSSLEKVVSLYSPSHLGVRVSDEEVLGLVPCIVSMEL